MNGTAIKSDSANTQAFISCSSPQCRSSAFKALRTGTDDLVNAWPCPPKESFRRLNRLTGTNAARPNLDDESQAARVRDRSAHRRPCAGVGDHRLLHAHAVLQPL